MIGRRLYAGDDLEGVEPGDYWKATDRNPSMPDGYWIVVFPFWREDRPKGVRLGTLNPAIHSIIEHEDGTITVSPSILQSWPDGREIWHGYLERGVWRSC